MPAECGLLLVFLWEPVEAEPLPLPDEPPPWLEELWFVALVDECFVEPVLVCLLVAPLGETPPLLVVCVEPPLFACLVCCLACLAGEVVVVVVVVVSGVVCDVVVEVCDVVVEVLVAAAAADLVVLDFEPLPPHALIPTASATEHSRPMLILAPVFLGNRGLEPTIPKNYSS